MEWFDYYKLQYSDWTNYKENYFDNFDISFLTSSLKRRANLNTEEIGPLAFSPLAASFIIFPEAAAAFLIASSLNSLALREILRDARSV